MRILHWIFLFLTVTVSYGQDILTIGEVFDFSIGDEFHYRVEGNLTYPNAERVTVIDKFFSSKNDTVFYKLAYDNYSTRSNWPPNYDLEYIFTKDTVVKEYSDLDSSILFFNPYHRYDSLVADTINGYGYRYDTIIGYKLCNTKITGYYLETGLIDFEPNEETFIYGKGLGLIYHDYVFGGHPSSSEPTVLFYFNKDNNTCGTPDMTTSIHGLDSKSSFQIYPNPVENDVYISFNNNIFYPYTLLIYSSNGLLIDSRVIDMRNYSFDLFSINKGVYIFKFQTEHEITTMKIIKE